MASVDDIFKRPNATPKRKLSELENPSDLYKKAKLEGLNDPTSHRATVQDGDGEDTAAGPELPPDFEDANGDEDRFYGGGISNDTADVLDYIEQQEKDGFGKLEKVDATWVRRIALNFEKKISKNAELRAKFEDNPQKFMSSEADLDADIKSLSILSEHPELYEEFTRLGCVTSLVSLLSHENTDIAIDVVQLTSELIDQDVMAEQEQWDALVNAMLEADLLELLLQNLSRFREEEEADRVGVYYVLEVLESLLSKGSIVDLVGKNTSIVKWLLSRATRDEPSVSQNKQYAAEVLAILLQSCQPATQIFIDMDGMDKALQILSSYRKRDPKKNSEEEEFMENFFDCLVCGVNHAFGKEKFLDAEGTELCVLMLKEGKMSRPRALRVLDHALSGHSGAACAVRLVEAAGLKHIFSLYMKRQDSQSSEHLLGIIASLLRLLPGESETRIRVLGKFVEKDYQKIERLIHLRWDYGSKLNMVEKEIQIERSQALESEYADLQSEWLSRRLEAGLFSIQTIDVILAWLVAEDDGARETISKALADKDESLHDLKRSIQSQIEEVSSDAEDASTTKDMLSTLMAFLE